MRTEGKLTKRQLQKRLHEDDMQILIDTVKGRSQSLWNEHGKSVMFAVIVVLGVYMVYWAYAKKAANDIVTRQEYFATALEHIGQAQQNVQQGIPGSESFQAAASELDRLLRDYGSSDTAVAANLLRGYCAVQLGEGERAKTYFERSTGATGDPSLKILFRLAQAQAEAGANSDPSTSVSTLNALVEDLEPGLMHDMATYMLAEAEERAGNDARALELYLSLPDDSAWRSLAERNIRWLEAEPLAPLNPTS